MVVANLECLKVPMVCTKRYAGKEAIIHVCVSKPVTLPDRIVFHSHQIIILTGVCMFRKEKDHRNSMIFLLSEHANR